jgi:hypothetical protein
VGFAGKLRSKLRSKIMTRLRRCGTVGQLADQGPAEFALLCTGSTTTIIFRSLDWC